MHALTLREHGPSDRPFLRQMLEATAIATYADLASLGRISLRERLDEIFEQHYAHARKKIWIACGEAGQPLGLVWLQPTLHPVTELADYLVLNLSVRPEARGQGVGRALMHHARAYALAHGVKRLRLFVASDNAPAQALYKGLGFEERTQEMVWLL